MRKSVTNENIIRLKELTNKIYSINYKSIVDELNAVIDEAGTHIKEGMDSEIKIKCYETMCQKIKNILINVR